jgi:iron(II)-dependent oxidoreductase
MVMIDFDFEAQLTYKSKGIADRLIDTRNRELELMQDLSNEQMIGSKLRIVEPPIWELGHVGWFQDRWILQNLDKRKPSDEKADALYNSFVIPNSERWDLLYPSRGQTFEYITDILVQIINRLESRDPSDVEAYFYALVLNHEEMHIETMHHIRQTFAYPAPKFTRSWSDSGATKIDKDFVLHDVEIPGGTYMLGGTTDMPFVFDNEKWAHPAKIEPFSISATPVTFSEYQDFTDEGGYQDRSIWSPEGWEWLQQSEQTQPVYWKKDHHGKWLWRWYDQWMPVEPFLPMVHVNWYEANAYCEWAGRRLPTEAEWELAASSLPEPDRKSFSPRKRWYPWGNDHPQPKHANLNSSMGIVDVRGYSANLNSSMGIVDVRGYSAGDSAFGLRQMIGNVWEWTADTFNPYPGYVIDPYNTYSEPSFGQQKVLRGGCWATRPHVIRNTFRNFYTPDRNNIFAGFRTVAT